VLIRVRVTELSVGGRGLGPELWSFTSTVTRITDGCSTEIDVRLRQAVHLRWLPCRMLVRATARSLKPAEHFVDGGSPPLRSADESATELLHLRERVRPGLLMSK